MLLLHSDGLSKVTTAKDVLASPLTGSSFSTWILAAGFSAMVRVEMDGDGRREEPTTSGDLQYILAGQRDRMQH